MFVMIPGLITFPEYVISRYEPTATVNPTTVVCVCPVAVRTGCAGVEFVCAAEKFPVVTVRDAL